MEIVSLPSSWPEVVSGRRCSWAGPQDKGRSPILIWYGPVRVAASPFLSVKLDSVRSFLLLFFFRLPGHHSSDFRDRRACLLADGRRPPPRPAGSAAGTWRALTDGRVPSSPRSHFFISLFFAFVYIYLYLYLFIKSGPFLQYFDFWFVIRHRHVNLHHTVPTSFLHITLSHVGPSPIQYPPAMPSLPVPVRMALHPP